MKFIQTCLCFCQQLPVSHLAQSCSKLSPMPSIGCLWVDSPSPVFTGSLLQLHLASALLTYLTAILFRWPVRTDFPSSLAALPHPGALAPLSGRWVRTRGSPPGHSGSDKPGPPHRLHLQGGERRDPRIIPFQKHIAWRSYQVLSHPAGKRDSVRMFSQQHIFFFLKSST